MRTFTIWLVAAFVLSAAGLLLGGGCKRNEPTSLEAYYETSELPPPGGGTPVAIGPSDPTPEDFAKDVALDQQLSWTGVAEATAYIVRFAAEGILLSSAAAANPSQTITTFDPGTLAMGTKYFWRVDWVDALGITHPGPVWCFTAGAKPGKASGPTPSDGAGTVSLNQALSWGSVSGTDEYVVYFGTVSPGTLQGCQSATTFTPAPMAVGTTYFWRIDTANAFGVTTGDVWTFATGSPPAQVSAVGAFPFNGQSGAPLTGKFRWSPAAGATSYKIYVGQSTPLGNSDYLGSTTSTSLTYGPGTLTSNQTWYWRADSVNEFGETQGVAWIFYPGYRGDLTRAVYAGYSDVDRGTKVEMLDDDTILTGGVFTQQADFTWFGDFNPVLYGMAGRNVYIAKCDFDPANLVTVQWKSRIMSFVEARLGGLSANADGTFFVGGSFIHHVLFDFGLPTQTEFYTDEANAEGFFVAKYKADGTLDWVKAATDGTSGLEYSLNGAVAAPDGGVFVTGDFMDDVTFAGTTMTVTGAVDSSDVFVAKLDGNGNLEWVRQSGCPSADDYGNDVSVLPDGSAVVVGNFYDCATFSVGESDAQFVPGNGNVLNTLDVFIARYADDGALIWVKFAGGMFPDEGAAIAASPDGSVYVTGTFVNSSVFGPGEAGEDYIEDVGGLGYREVFIAKYFGDNGALVWVDQGESGGLSDIEVFAITATDNYVYTTGGFHANYGLTLSPLGSNPTTVASSAGMDAYIACWNAASGELDWAFSGYGNARDIGRGVDASDTVLYATGAYRDGMWFESTGDFIPPVGPGTADIWLGIFNP